MRGDSPTPTYDPFAQPPLPPDPTEYEFGRYLYWRHCMPCHGDRGQGLTDEFRSVWVEDHQNCWARGCHSGKYAEDSFYVPTIVPALVTGARLVHFETQEDLLDYLRSTHPPQDPGFLEEDEYRALAFFVFSMNDRLTAEPTSQPTLTPTPSLLSILIISFFILIRKRTEVRATDK
jgi:cytochrome c